ncbi:MAG: ABC transporter permease [Pseudomonadota bacterium]
MFGVVVRRLALGVPTIFAATLLLFVSVAKLGSPAAEMLGQDATPDAIAALNLKYGFDKPVLEQYLNWLASALHGDLGRSYVSQELVSETLIHALPVSLELAFWAFLFALLASVILNTVPVGRSLLTPFTTSLNVIGMAVPNFMLGLFLIFFFAIRLKILPTTGWVGWDQGPFEHLRHLVLPVLTLAAYYFATFSIIYRAEFLSVQRRLFVRVAAAKGLSNWHVAFTHILPNAILPVITIAGLSIGQAIGGAVVTETIFSMPGVGGLFVSSIVGHDFPTMLAIGMITVAGVVLFNTIADLLLAIVNPLIRMS